MFTFICICIFPVYSYTFTTSSNFPNLHIKSGAIYYWSGIWRWSQACWGAGVSLFFTIGILTLLFMLFPNSICIISSCHFFPLFIYYHCVRYLYVILQWYWFIVVDFIVCLGYFKLSICAWGIFLVNIRRRLSSRLHFRVFWEAGSEPCLLKKGPSSYRWPETSYIYTTINI